MTLANYVLYKHIEPHFIIQMTNSPHGFSKFVIDL